MAVFKVKLCLNKQCLWEITLTWKLNTNLCYFTRTTAKPEHLHFFISPKPHEISWSQSRLTCVRKNSAESSENETEIQKVAAAEAGTHSSPCWSSVWITFSKQIQKVKPLTAALGRSVPINIFLLFFLTAFGAIPQFGRCSQLAAPVLQMLSWNEFGSQHMKWCPGRAGGTVQPWSPAQSQLGMLGTFAPPQ